MWTKCWCGLLSVWELPKNFSTFFHTFPHFCMNVDEVFVWSVECLGAAKKLPTVAKKLPIATLPPIRAKPTSAKIGVVRVEHISEPEKSVSHPSSKSHKLIKFFHLIILVHHRLSKKAANTPATFCWLICVIRVAQKTKHLVYFQGVQGYQGYFNQTRPKW